MRVYKCRCGHETVFEHWGPWGACKPKEIKCSFCGNRDHVCMRKLEYRKKKEPSVYVDFNPRA